MATREEEEEEGRKGGLARLTTFFAVRARTGWRAGSAARHPAVTAVYTERVLPSENSKMGMSRWSCKNALFFFVFL